VVIWYIFFGFGILYREKSGNPIQTRQICRVGSDLLDMKATDLITDKRTAKKIRT
jgi:hypothetical protein